MIYSNEYEVTEEELKALYEYRTIKDNVTCKVVKQLYIIYSDEDIKDILENKNPYVIRGAKSKIKSRYIKLV